MDKILGPSLGTRNAKNLKTDLLQCFAKANSNHEDVGEIFPLSGAQSEHAKTANGL